MSKTLCKRILGLFIFAFMLLGIASPMLVKAESEKCNKKRAELEAKNGEEFINKYGLDLKYNSDDKVYELKMQKVGKTLAAELSKSGVDTPKFEIVKIAFFTPGGEEGNVTKDYDGASYTKKEQIKEFVDNGVISKSTITPGKKITIKRSGFGTIKEGIEITLKPVNFKDYELSSACCTDPSSSSCNTDFDIALDVVVTEYQAYDDDTIYKIDDGGYSISSGKINCSNYKNDFDSKSFEYNFCHDKDEAGLLSGSKANPDTRKFTIKDYDIDGTSKGEEGRNVIKYEGKTKYTYKDVMPFKCDWNKMSAGVSTDSSEYYVNRKYLYGEGSFEITLGDYTYNTECGGEKSTPAKCKIKCEEIVTVEYGPPVASTAGLCFEYKVKVTSRVDCGLDGDITKPREAVVCTPTPVCTHKSGVVHTVGGPDDDFDDCVEACDGGKYTDKCTNKCYKKIYGVSIVKKTTGSELAYTDKLEIDEANTVRVETTAVDESLYTFTCDKSQKKNQQILWNVGKSGETKRNYKKYGGNGLGGNNIPTDPYYHLRYGWSSKYRYFNVYRNGIPAIDWCSAECHWEFNTTGKCGEKNADGTYKYVRYLNHPDIYSGKYSNIRSQIGAKDTTAPIDKDKEKNQKLYKQLKDQCEAYASCNTTTAEFTISVDYSTKDGEVKKIEFPLSTKKDTITNTGNNKATCSQKVENGNSVFLGYAGCYDCDGDESKRFYQTEWSFPGTFIHKKTGEITFDGTKINTKTWKEYADKFCLPLNVANVNTKWYNYYYAKMYGDSKNISYNDKAYIDNITCPDGTKPTGVSCEYQNSKFTNDDAKKIKYNINALAKRFGLFEWNIQISCFYAVNDEFPGTEEKKCDPVCGTGKGSDKEYRIRSVDLTNIFPDDKGSETTWDKTGRTPGFNWSQWSSQTIKDPEYTSLPSSYTKWVQKKGYQVYSDDYLDYEVNLTKELIKKVNDQLDSQNGNYTAWQGDVQENSVVNYQSPLFRNGGILSSTSKYPKGDAIKCNNMKNWKSTECEDFSGEVK